MLKLTLSPVSPSTPLENKSLLNPIRLVVNLGQTMSRQNVCCAFCPIIQCTIPITCSHLTKKEILILFQINMYLKPISTKCIKTLYLLDKNLFFHNRSLLLLQHLWILFHYLKRHTFVIHHNGLFVKVHHVLKSTNHGEVISPQKIKDKWLSVIILIYTDNQPQESPQALVQALVPALALALALVPALTRPPLLQLVPQLWECHIIILHTNTHTHTLVWRVKDECQLVH